MVGILYVFMITDNYHHLLLISLRSFQIFEYSSKTIIKPRKVHEIQYQVYNLDDYSVNTIIGGDTKFYQKFKEDTRILQTNDEHIILSKLIWQCHIQVRDKLGCI